jgi:putative transcriptional regulator
MSARHPSEATLLAYAAGTLAPALAIVAAAHLRTCSACRGDVALLEAAGGALLDAAAPEPLAEAALRAALDRLDAPLPPAPALLHPGLPPPLDRVRLGRWWPVAPGVRWRLLRVPGPAFGALVLAGPGRALPVHAHRGLELTAVLSGAFADASGQYVAGDLCEPDGPDDHRPVAIGAEPCLCVIASEGVRLRGAMGLVQRLAGL